MELIMFNFYIKKMIENSLNQDGTIDYNKCSDYKISKDLGITQQRIKNLKIKNQLINPIDFDWKKSLAVLTKNARYDQTTHKIILNIPDPNLYLEIQNFLEEEGAYIEKQLNSKVLQLRIEYYIALIIVLEEESNRHIIINELKRQFKNSNQIDKLFDEKNIGKSLIEGAVSITGVLASLGTLISSDNTIGQALLSLFSSQ